jgi:hypothetical protein
MKYLFILAVLIGCHCKDPSEIDTNGNLVSAPGNELQQAQCDGAKKNLMKPTLQCKDSYGLIIGDKNSNGEDFSITCQQLLVHKIPVNIGCLTSAKTCDDVKKCDK